MNPMPFGTLCLSDKGGHLAASPSVPISIIPHENGLSRVNYFTLAPRVGLLAAAIPSEATGRVESRGQASDGGKKLPRGCGGRVQDKNVGFQWSFVMVNSTSHTDIRSRDWNSPPDMGKNASEAFLSPYIPQAVGGQLPPGVFSLCLTITDLAFVRGICGHLRAKSYARRSSRATWPSRR